MNSAPIEFHKIWIDQCAATEGISEKFGLENALNYLDRRETLLLPARGPARSSVRCRGACLHR